MLKNILRVAVATLLVVAAAGCHDEQADPPADETGANPPTGTVPIAVVMEAQRATQLQTESALVAKDAEKSRWQSFALLMTTGALVSFVGGTILGAKARHEVGQ